MSTILCSIYSFRDYGAESVRVVKYDSTMPTFVIRLRAEAWVIRLGRLPCHCMTVSP